MVQWLDNNTELAGFILVVLCWAAVGLGFFLAENLETPNFMISTRVH